MDGWVGGWGQGGGGLRGQKGMLAVESSNGRAPRHTIVGKLYVVLSQTGTE